MTGRRQHMLRPAWLTHAATKCLPYCDVHMSVKGLLLPTLTPQPCKPCCPSVTCPGSTPVRLVRPPAQPPAHQLSAVLRPEKGVATRCPPCRQQPAANHTPQGDEPLDCASTQCTKKPLTLACRHAKARFFWAHGAHPAMYTPWLLPKDSRHQVCQQ